MVSGKYDEIIVS